MLDVDICFTITVHCINDIAVGAFWVPASVLVRV